MIILLTYHGLPETLMRTENTYAISAADSPPTGCGLVADSGGLKAEEIILKNLSFSPVLLNQTPVAMSMAIV